MQAAAPARLVLDTNVWLDLLLFDDRRCLGLRQALASGRALAFVDAACREEWCRVLTYPALRLDAGQRAALQGRWDAMATLHAAAPPAAPAALPRCADPDDQKFLELALAVQASVLVTRDAALLALAPRTRRAGLFRICPPGAAVWGEAGPGHA